MDEDDIKRTYEIGEKNLATLQLIKNWCAHVRVRKFGGVGMIEQATGYPIGHHHLECDFSTNGGMGCWDMEDSAIDFHDRNCVGCAHRSPVGFPNISEMVSRRDKALEQKRLEDERFTEETERQATVRRQKRAKIRQQLSPIGQTVLDQLAALDGNGSSERETELVTAVRLAPHAVEPPLVDYLFELIEDSAYWALEPAAEILPLVSTDKPRLARAAMLILDHRASEAASTLLQANIEDAPAELVAGAVGGLINLARPYSDPFADMNRPRDPAGIRALHRRHPTEVEKAISRLFDETDPWRLSQAARGVVALGDADPAVAMTFIRDVLSKMARSGMLAGRSIENGEAEHELRRAAGIAFEHQPVEVDKLIGSYRLGATDEGQRRLFSIYRHVLGYRFEKTDVPPVKAAGMALDRLIWCATEDLPSDILREIQSAFSARPRELMPIVKDRIESLLGAAILIADRIQEIGIKLPAEPTPLSAMEAMGRQITLRGLMNSLIAWAAKASRDDPEAIDRYLSLAEGLPEDRADLRGAMISDLSSLVRTPERLGLVLSPLYAAMMGASVGGRVAAVQAFAEMDRLCRQDAPLLLWEAFVALLADPYLAPVKAAVKALDRVNPPDEFMPGIRARLAGIIAAYAKANQEELVVGAVTAFADRCLNDEESTGPWGDWLLETIALQDPLWFRRELFILFHNFRRNPNLVSVLVRVLRDGPYDADDAIEVLALLPPDILGTGLEEVIAAVGEWSPDADGWWHLLDLVEVFTYAAYWAEADCLLAGALQKIPDTPHEGARRGYVHQLRCAIAAERALIVADEKAFADAAAKWSALDDDAGERRSSRDGLDAAFAARLEGVAALLEGRSAERNTGADLVSAADRIDTLTEAFTAAPVARQYTAFAELLRAANRVMDWRADTLNGRTDAERHLRAARGRLELWRDETGDQIDTRFSALADELASLQTLKEVKPLLEKLALTALPVATRAGHKGIRLPRSQGKAIEAEDRPVQLAVAFLQFKIDGDPAAETHYLTPCQVHDLDLEVRVSRWPEGAETLKLTPVTIEPSGTHAFPSFELQRPSGDAPFTLHAKGRAILHASQSLRARPFEFRYTARFLPPEQEQPVSVVGQRNLRIEGVDLRSGRLTGYPQLDARTLQIRDELRARAWMTPTDMESLLAVLIPLANFAGRSVQDNLVGEPWSEARVQSTLRDDLRRRPEIGVDLEEHPSAAGGISDLSFKGLKIELKAETARRLTLKDCQSYVDQTVSYVVASGMRVGILCVIDGSPKSSPPFPVEDGIGILSPSDGSDVRIVTVLVQGNLARPSALSR